MSRSLTQPPSPLEMTKIALNLTAVSLIAAAILGGMFMITEPIRLKNVHARETQMIQHLLDLSEDAKIIEIRRYQTASFPVSTLYLTPNTLIQFSNTGTLLTQLPITDQLSLTASPDDKDRWVKAQFKNPESSEITFMERFFIGREGTQTQGYVVESAITGFKSIIRFFVAMDHAFTLRGLEIIEQEEDPGLGAEIAQKFFKNQFAGRPATMLSHLKVTKNPLPNDWKTALEELGVLRFEAWSQKYQPMLEDHAVIYALTGATISSKAVTDGLKRAIRNFQFRLKTLEAYL